MFEIVWSIILFLSLTSSLVRNEELTGFYKFLLYVAWGASIVLINLTVIRFIFGYG